MFSFLRDPRERLLKKMPVGGICAEIGVWQGAFSERILTVTRPASLHLIDPWAFASNFPQRWYGGAKAASQSDMDSIYDQVTAKFSARREVTIHRVPSIAAASDFPDGHFDWVYIDGDHSKAAVLADLKAWHPKIRKGGFLTGDDYRWVDEAGRLSVKAAVDEFVRHLQMTPTIVRSQFMLEV